MPLLHEFGQKNEQTLVMIHGTAMSWDMFRDSIGILSERFRVFAVSVPGHDPEEISEFTSVEEVSRQIEDALIAAGCAEIHVLYGLSMGGAIAVRMLADDRLPVRHAVIDGGITPYELPWIATRLILLKDFLMTEWGKHSKKALSLAFPPEVYTQEGLDRMAEVLRHMTKKSIWRVYDSTDNYSMPDVFPAVDTQIQYWYGSEEKNDRKLDIQYMRRHIPNVVFRELKGMSHGQYSTVYSKEFSADLIQLCEKETK